MTTSNGEQVLNAHLTGEDRVILENQLARIPKVGDMVLTHLSHRGHTVPIEGDTSSWGFTLPLPQGGAFVLSGQKNIFDVRPIFETAVDAFYYKEGGARPGMAFAISV